MIQEILAYYGIAEGATTHPFGQGLINHTWQVKNSSNEYILQKVNTGIFKNPLLIAGNIEKIASHLAHTNPGYFFVSPVPTLAGEPMLHVEDHGYFRLFPFVKGSVTFDVIQTPGLAFEAARQFGLFTRMLHTFPAAILQTTLPDFHNLTLRYQQFTTACLTGNTERIRQSNEEINFLKQQHHLVSVYENILVSREFKLRVTHHDTKISNVLFDAHGKGICVIDLDTVMPGYFISDVGDMMRTYLPPVSEEETDLTKIEIREDYFKAILQGYLHEMANDLSTSEKAHFVYAGMFMIYMQALRFLTDHLHDDRYYGAVYEGQNFKRAKNQIVLLQQMIAKEDTLLAIVSQTIQAL